MSRKQQSVYFVSLGCPKNRVDTEVMLGLTDHAGLSIVNAPERAYYRNSLILRHMRAQARCVLVRQRT
jgi:hypothetical protein